MNTIYERSYDGKHFEDVSVATVVKYAGNMYGSEEAAMNFLHENGEIRTRFALYRVKAGRRGE